MRACATSKFFEEISYYFSLQLYHFTFPPAVPISPHLCQHLLFSVCFLIVTILMDLRWYFVVFWFAFLWWLCWASFHMLVDHLYIFFGEKSIQVLCTFFNWVIHVFIYYLLVMDINPLLDIWFANTFCHSVCCLFTLLILFTLFPLLCENFKVWCLPMCLLFA